MIEDYGKKQDLWLAAQLDAINGINCSHSVDVTDRVMQQIASRPLLVPAHRSRRQRRGWVSAITAACVVGLVVVIAQLPSSQPMANNMPTVTTSSLSERVSSIYSFCQDYASYEDDAASYHSNPVNWFIN